MRVMRTRDRGVSTALTCLAVATVAIVVIVGAWLLSVALSDPVGRGEAVKEKNTSTNRIFAQQRFEQLNADVDATRAKITAAEKVRASSPEAETRYQGLVSYCASVVADYNAAARSYTQQDFRAADLPASLNPTADCEPTP